MKKRKLNKYVKSKSMGSHDLFDSKKSGLSVIDAQQYM
jgi:hypothetical protein